VWRPSDRFEAKLGLPPALEWRPTDDWTFTANYFPLVNFNATVRRRLADGLSLIAFYRSDTEIYFLADRLQDDQRFYVFDQRAAVGLERTLGRGFALVHLRPPALPRHEFSFRPHRLCRLRPRPRPLAAAALAAVNVACGVPPGVDLADRQQAH
jgi:hypothetical protein